LRKLAFGILAIAAFAMMASPVHADGTFDQWGYNRTALIFNGWFVNAYAEREGFATPYVGVRGDPCGNIDLYFAHVHVTCDPATNWPSNPRKYPYAYNVLLQINVNKAWDDAHRGVAPWTPDAWLTNHMIGWYLGVDGKVHQWEWFLKIVWIGPHGSRSPYWRPGGYATWGEFEVIEDLYNDLYGGFHGKENLAIPAGLGYG